MEKVKRMYVGSDAFMAESARTIHNLLTQDLSTFQAINTRFNSAFLEDFLSKIDAADKVVTDSNVVAQQGSETEQVLTAMQRARKLYNRVKNHATWAFAQNSPATLNEFTTGYRKASRRQPEMLVFLETLERVITKHLTILADANKGGMPDTVLEELRSIKEELKSKNVTQETSKKQRGVLTEQRINTLNNCYRVMISINNTAQVVFDDQPAKRAQYTYRPATDTADSQEYTGDVNPQEVKVIATLVYEPSRFLSFENRGLVPLQFDLSLDDSTLEGNLVDLGGGATINQQMIELINGIEEGTEVKLLVRNISNDQIGSYWAAVNLE